jgi:hypothetical protein
LPLTTMASSSISCANGSHGLGSVLIPSWRPYAPRSTLTSRQVRRASWVPKPSLTAIRSMANSMSACGGAPEPALRFSVGPGGVSPGAGALAVGLQPHYHRPPRNPYRFHDGLHRAAGGDMARSAG